MGKVSPGLSIKIGLVPVQSPIKHGFFGSGLLKVLLVATAGTNSTGGSRFLFSEGTDDSSAVFLMKFFLVLILFDFGFDFGFSVTTSSVLSMIFA